MRLCHPTGAKTANFGPSARGVVINTFLQQPNVIRNLSSL